MRIKKFSGITEKEVIDRVKEELGLDALVLNIKKIKPRGIFALFRKPRVEVTAAYEERTGKRTREGRLEEEQKKVREAKDGIEKMLKERKIAGQDEKIRELTEKLASTEALLEKAVSRLSVARHRQKEQKYQNNMIQIFYEAMTAQGVLSEISEELLGDLDRIDDKEEIEIEMIVRIVYEKVLEMLGPPKPLSAAKKGKTEATAVLFIGPTGVGKTTTIAKLSADFILNRRLEVGLITADTYRIAAIEQLKTYAEILSVEVQVCYHPEELPGFISTMSPLNDLILIDTAGRSHKNKAHMAELKAMIAALPDSEKFLVLSLTTKYEDLLNIVNAYAKLADFQLIFTKLDETLCWGSILNVCHTTGKKVSYVTTGQNVPEDIEAAKPDKIARALLGLLDEAEDEVEEDAEEEPEEWYS